MRSDPISNTTKRTQYLPMVLIIVTEGLRDCFNTSENVTEIRVVEKLVKGIIQTSIERLS